MRVVRVVQAILRAASLRALTAVGFALPSVTAVADAQASRGTVVDERGAPVAGAVVLLLDSASDVVMRSLTNDQGEYRLRAPQNGEYRVRTLRIGFRPSAYGPFTLESGADFTHRLVLTGLPVSLATVSVVDQSPCRSLGDSTASTFMVWEQIRTALTAAQLTEAGRPMSSTMVLYERFLNPQTARVTTQSSRILSNVQRHPWRTILADSLHRRGYIVTHRDGSLTYYAPGLEVLLSDMFLEDHCFRLQRSTDPKHIGVAFEPVPDRSRIPEIRGMVWIDRESSQLRSMEFEYTNTMRQRSQYAGGRVDYVRMSTGEWVISAWEIRMPILRVRSRAQRGGSLNVNPEVEVAAVKVDAGELVMVVEGTDTLWSRRPSVFRGAVVDSTGRSVAGARVTVLGTRRSALTDGSGRYSIDGVLLGGYMVEVTTASLDSVADVHLAQLGFADGSAFHEIRVPTADQVAETACADTPGGAQPSSRESHGLIAGTVRTRGDSLPYPAAWVIAEWTPPARPGAEAPVSRRLQEMTDARGMFRFCGIPVNVDISLKVLAENHGSAPIAVRVPTGRRFVHVPLTVEPVR